MLSLLAIFLTDKFLLVTPYTSLFDFNIFHFLIYIFYLLYKIFTSGYKAAVLTIKGNAHLIFFTYESVMTDDFSLNLLSNSITLTPGTVTVNRQDNSLLIMQLCPDKENCNTSEIVKFENKIKKLKSNKVKSDNMKAVT